MSRYRTREPLCHHARKGIVSSGDHISGPYASTQVCDRAGCIEDAKAWARAQTHLPATFHPDPQATIVQGVLL